MLPAGLRPYAPQISAAIGPRAVGLRPVVWPQAHWTVDGARAEEPPDLGVGLPQTSPFEAVYDARWPGDDLR
jgi:hypothetical protein